VRCTFINNFFRIVVLIIILAVQVHNAVGGEKKPKDYLKNVGTGLNLFSVKEEKSIGERYSKEMNAKLVLLSDTRVQAYVESIGRRLATASRQPDLRCTFRVVNTREVNAFALPGCFVYVNRGLIELAENEGQLAGVMAHEIGHVVGHHATKQMTKQLALLGAVAGASAAVGAKSKNWSAVIATAGGVAAMLASMKYSRDDEHQADALAAETLTKAGYDPAALVTFFHRMDSAEKTGMAARVLNLLSTHPPTPDRELAITQQIVRLDYKLAASSPDIRKFQAYKTEIAALPKPPGNKEKTLSNALAEVGLAESAAVEDSPPPIGARYQARNVFDMAGKTVWMETGIEVQQGTIIEFWGEGEVFIKKNSDLSCDPSGVFGTGKGWLKPISHVNTGALIGRIVTNNGSRTFPVGTHRVLRADAAGKLELGVNDDNNFDNRGSFRIWILIR
jgi:Zn-dependent protease with chaperone function